MTDPIQGIESRFAEVVAMPVEDEATARDALTELLATVAQINEAAPAPTERLAVSGGLVERLKEWIDKLIDQLRKIVREIPYATSFSLTVGPPGMLSVTVTFGPFEQGLGS
jgi:hypothetical protein